MTAKVACGFQGHVWSPWQAQIELPTKARQCHRCGRREAYWLTASDYRRSTIPRVEFEGKPTMLQRFWAALSITAAWLAGLLKLCARTAAAWLTAAHSHLDALIRGTKTGSLSREAVRERTLQAASTPTEENHERDEDDLRPGGC